MSVEHLRSDIEKGFQSAGNGVFDMICAILAEKGKEKNSYEVQKAALMAREIADYLQNNGIFLSDIFKE